MPPASTSRMKSSLGLLLLAYLAFIALGLPDGLLGVAWPTMRESFLQPLDALGMLMITGTIGYLSSSFMSGKLITRFGVGKLLAASCALTGLGLVGYTLAPVWWVMVGIGIFTGLGAGAIDAGLNTYIATNFGERPMQWLHASYGVGITLGPIIMTAGLEYMHTWRTGYVIVGVVQLALAVCFLFTISLWHRPSTNSAAGEKPQISDFKTPFSSSLREWRVWLSVVLFLFYTGAEVTLGSWAYSLLTEGRGIDPQTAGLWAGSFWGTFMVGRILAGIITKKLGGHRLLVMSMSGGLLGAILLFWNPADLVSLFGVVLFAFSLAPIFPGLISGTRERVGSQHAVNTIGMQMGAAGFGAAVLPALGGVLARRISLEIIPVYLIILLSILFGLYLLSMKNKPIENN
jgi:fucose permease